MNVMRKRRADRLTKEQVNEEHSIEDREEDQRRQEAGASKKSASKSKPAEKAEEVAMQATVAPAQHWRRPRVREL